jgi:hypothetical protein
VTPHVSGAALLPRAIGPIEESCGDPDRDRGDRMRDQPRKNGDEHAHDDEDEPDGEHGPGLDGFEPPRIDRRCYVDEMRHTR